MMFNGSWFRSTTSQRKEEASAAHITGTEQDVVRKLVLNAEVEVVGLLRALRVKHGAKRGAKIVAQPVGEPIKGTTPCGNGLLSE